MSGCFCFRNTSLVPDQCMEKLKTSLSDKNVFDILEQSTGDIGMWHLVFFQSKQIAVQFYLPFL